MRRYQKLARSWGALALLRVLILALSHFLCALAASNAQTLEKGFAHPPDSARPCVYWFWVDGNVTREGITADLEAMRRAGIGGALLFDVTQDLPLGPVRFGSPAWRNLFKHAVSEASRLGLELSVNNDAGWTGSGGPWIDPEHAMQQLVWSKTNIVGPISFHGPLPPLRKLGGFSREIAILAFPVLVGDGAPIPGFAPKITSSGGPIIAGNLLDRNPATSVSVPAPRPGKPQYLQLEFKEPFIAQHLGLTASGGQLGLEGELETSEDGKRFRSLRQFLLPGDQLALEFEQVSARFYRIVFRQADLKLSRLNFTELDLVPVFRIPLYFAKTGAGRGPWPLVPSTNIPAYAVISLTNVLDLSSNLNSDGTFTWQAPKGEWTVLRFGHAPVGTDNHPSPTEGLGLECDKLSKEAIRVHFSGFLAHLLDDAGEETGRAFKGTHIDSWEIGYQNWTPRFLEEFRARRHYEALPYLPAYAGRFVQSPEVSERFLCDVRRTIADLLAENYAGGLAELAHQHGLTLSIQAYANGPFDQLTYAGRADQPAAEFWTEKDDYGRFQTAKVMSSAAHTYGKVVVSAESFSAYPSESTWKNHPFSQKALGDGAMVAGVNRFFIHRFAHQPWLDRRPGMTMGPWGLNYERTETWWEQSRPWHEYLARCHFLLQQGIFVADFCYLTDENSYSDPPAITRLNPAVPAGCAFDFISPEAVLSRLSCRDGRLVLPDGMNYKVLVLPGKDRMTPQLLEKIAKLVEAGATVVGMKPAKSLSLQDYPACDATVQTLAARLWADCDGKSVKEHRAGKGKVVAGKELDQVLAELGTPPDFEVVSKVTGFPLRYAHRQDGETEIYFIANSNGFPVTAECAFRAQGKAPEIWHPDTGEQDRAAAWEERNGRTFLHLRLDDSGSIFVLFRPVRSASDPIVALLRNGSPQFPGDLRVDAGGKSQLLAFEPGTYELRSASGRKSHARIAELPDPLPISGNWEVSFPPKSGAPGRATFDRLISWTASKDPGIKYFSGTAVYRKTVIVPASFQKPNRRLWLDLGNVQVIAEAKLNGKTVGIAWKPPFRLDISREVRTGTNLIEIGVVNCWVNRLIGDEQLPDDCAWKNPTSGNSLGRGLAAWPQWLKEGRPSPTGRLTFATWKFLTKDSPLLNSGLLGPVTLRPAEELTFSAADGP